MSGESEAAVKSGESNQNLKVLGKYVIERKLGQGGMGTVYLAKNSDLKKTIALKVLPQDKAKNPTLVKRFKSEAQAAAKLEHPNIVAVYDTGEADGYLYIAMEFVDGIDLFEHVKRRGVIPVKRSIEIIKQVTSALQHAYEQNIVHRDIKPSNLLLRRDGVVKLTDLGLARSIDDTLETNITRAGTTVGTVDYMAPEQARSSKLADIRSDIYSLGCTWYQMLTGEPPFPDGSLTNKLQAHAVKPFPDPREINENVPEGLLAVLQRMTAKKPDDRYQSPAELLEDLTHSKLTRAEFADEIFSDLSDHEMSAYNKTSDEDELEDDQDVDEPDADGTTQRKHRSQAKDESSSTVARRKSPLQNDTEEPQRKKTRSRDGETGHVDETQPLKSVRRSPSKAQEEDDDRPVSPKRSKGSSASEPADIKSQKGSHKPLPPKRQAVEEAPEEAPKFNAEVLKYLASIGGLLAVICGVGLLVFRWSNQFEAVNHPLPMHPTVPPELANPAPPAKTKESPEATKTAETTKTQTTPAEKSPVEFDFSKQSLPAWAASDAAEPRDFKTLTVGPGAPSPTHFAGLDGALEAIEPGSTVIRLIGNGPFQLTNGSLKPGIKLVISAATPQDQPLVFIKPHESGQVLGLNLEGGMLDLRGLHFLFDRPQDMATTSNKLVTVTDGQLFVRNCSFTASGKDTATTTALSCNFKQETMSPAAPEAQLLLDHVVVRGNGMAGLSIDRPTIDAVVQDSLFLTGTAPAILVNAHQLTPNMIDTPQSRPLRLIRVIRSTLCVRKEAFEIAAESNTKPPLTALLLQDSVCSAEGSGNSAVLFSATRWPSVTSNNGGWLTNLSLSSPASLFLGFERLIDLDKSAFRVTNLETWQRVWGKKFDPRQFQSLFWQESTFADLSAASPQDFDNAALPYLELKTGAGTPPGCAVSRLTVPGMVSQDRLFALSQRQPLPALIQKPIDSTPWKKVDLSKEDLGQVINKNDWPSGTVIEATGAGIKQMSSAKISGKALRIVFRQGEGAALRIQPKASSDHPPVFEVENGLLDLQSATIDSSSSAKGPSLACLIRTLNGNLILRGCQLNGPTQPEIELNHGLIEWTTTADAQPFEGIDVPFLSVNDSFLMGNGNGLRVGNALGNVFLRNSVLAIRGYGLNVHPDFARFRAGSTIDMEHVTFSTTKGVLRFEAAEGVETAPAPVRFFVNYCVVCPPMEFRAGEGAESALVEVIGPVREQKQMQWWGTSNGIAKELKTLLKTTDGDPIVAPNDWSAAWGENSEFRLLSGNKGVTLSANLPNKFAGLKVNSFTLSPNCPAASWADGGQPLGAEILGVETAIVAKKNSLETKAASAAGPSPSNSTTTKKNLGF